MRVHSDAENNVLDMGAKYRRRALLWWAEGHPKRILIVKKRGDDDAADMLRRIGAWWVLLGNCPFVIVS